MLELSSLTKSYSKNLVLKDVSFSIKEGEIFGLLGPNGAGKSTLIRIVNQIITADSGWIKFDNTILKQSHLREIGYLPEERGLYRSMTVEDHGVFMGRLRGLSKTESNKMLDFWLEKLAISDWKKKRIEELSKGMAQKIQFIYTVLHQPRLIILDEPFSGFDPLNIELIKKEIIEFRKEGRSVLISTHNMNSVEEICDRAMLINKGRTILEGPVHGMRENLKQGFYEVRFGGNMIAFVNALWAGFEIVQQKALSDNRFEVVVSMRGENSIDELLSVLIGQVKIESVSEKLPSMQEVFVRNIEMSNQENVEDAQ